jgi:hypothetical protein
MTCRRRDAHSTEFGLWLRDVKPLDSKQGYIATNVDFIWSNFYSKEWMIIEEKRYFAGVPYWQRGLFASLHNLALSDAKYKGLVVLQFQKTSPSDGKMYWNKEEITEQDVINRLSKFSCGFMDKIDDFNFPCR